MKIWYISNHLSIFANIQPTCRNYMKLKQGTSLQNGKYIINEILGQGGFGITYLGIQLGLNRQVAIKEFFMADYCEREGDSTIVTTIGTQNTKQTVDAFRNKFKKEAQNIASLNHPGIVKVYDVFEENGTAYYVMEYLSGGSLKDKLDKEGSLSAEDARRYLRQVAEALDYMHHCQIEVEKGITSMMLHLDVKPANILLNGQDRAVLVDFGLSKRYDESGNQTSDTPMGISEGYAPLEQYETGGIEHFTPATDIYALGATAYHMLSGKRPPKASYVLDTGLLELSKSLPADLTKTIRLAMRPLRKDRPQDIQTFLSTLKVPGKKVNKVVLIASVVAAVIGIAGYLAYNNYTKPRELYAKAMTYVEGDNDDLWNVGEAVRLMKQAAEMGYDEAQFQLGLFYYDDEYDIEDEGKAIEWWLKAADKGHINSMKALGAHYKDEDEDELAVKYFMPAAEKGDAVAQWIIGDYYEDGDGGLPESEKIAAEWYRKSAEQNNATGQLYLGYCYLYGDGVEEDAKIGIEYVTKAAEQGDVEALESLAGYYNEGRFVDKDTEKAKELYALAAKEGETNSMYMLASIYEIEGNFDEAFKWWKLGADHYHTYSTFAVGYYHYMGLGKVDINYEEAYKWFLQAAKWKQSAAQYYLGGMLYEGIGVKADKVQAVEWWEKSANQDHPWALIELGKCYENGEVVGKDVLKAIEYYQKAANHRLNKDASQRAKEHLERLKNNLEL